jgi:hypothetical protein
MDFTLERLLCGTQRSEKVKPFPSTRVTLSFSEKTISVNTGVIHEKNEIKSTRAKR